MCGLFGFSKYGNEKFNDLSDLTNSLAEQSATRGTDATGVAFNRMSNLNIFKDSKSASITEDTGGILVLLVMDILKTIT